jgi:DNA-binding MarR family transcriptional regulator
MPTRRNPQPVAKPALKRIGLLKAVLQGYRVRLDEDLHPLGITTAQLKLLWSVEQNPQVSGAQLARLCAITPQTGQASLAAMETHGWIRRHASAGNERVLVTELTASGRRVLERAKLIAEALDRSLWQDASERELAAVDRVLGRAMEQLGPR